MPAVGTCPGQVHMLGLLSSRLGLHTCVRIGFYAFQAADGDE